MSLVFFNTFNLSRTPNRIAGGIRALSQGIELKSGVVFMMDRTSGQALVEFVFFSLFSSIFVGFAGFILKEEWNRSKCAYLTFEKTHHDLLGSSLSEEGEVFSLLKGGGGPSFSFQIEEHGQEIVGIGLCRGHQEKIRLPLLETAQW